MKFNTWLIAAVAALLLLMGSVYTVSEGQGAIVLNLGRVVRSDIGPGLHFKWPLVESARIFDRRLQVLDAEPERYLTSERKDVSVDFFAVGQIQDLRAFYRATGGQEDIAIQRLAPIIKDSLRNEINSRTLSQVVSGDRSAIVDKELAAINKGAATLGVRIVALRIKQIALPTDSEVIGHVYRRMRAQRQQVAC
jgi:membrane protease subunit HflC